MNRMKRLIIAENNIRVTREVELEECARIFEGAVKRWANEMYVIVRGMSNNLMEYDDFYSEGMLCLIEMYDKYVPVNTFNTALHKSLDNLKIDLIRKANAKKRKTEQSVVSFDMEIEDDECDCLQEIEGDIDMNYSIMEFNEDMANALATLSNEERKIVGFLMDNESTKRVLAKELNISRPTLDSRITKVKEKIMDLLPEYIFC